MQDAARMEVLLVEDAPALAKLYLAFLKDERVVLDHAADGRSALARLRQRPPAVLLLDLNLPDMHGLDILREVRSRGLPTTVVVITVDAGVSLVVEAMRAGAYDFLVKPINADRLIITLRNALERQRLTALVESYRRDSFHGFIGASLPMQAVYRAVESVAESNAPVFITGESGSGKEVCAAAIHQASRRRGRSFVAINCGAFAKELIESELFGHVKGAFTGAICDRKGAAARADGGTLFLDEICEMDPALQTKLLRFTQTGVVQPLGSDRSERVDLRLICATNRDPLAAVADGRFREDLYYRLHVVPIALPALRERGDDILALARTFLADFAAEEGKAFKAFTPQVEERLLVYGWPGNVRQLQNVIRNIVVLNDGEQVETAMLPPLLDPTTRGTQRPHTPMPARPLHQVERETIEAAIAECHGSIPRAAALLQVSPSTLYRKRIAWAEEQSA